MNRSRPRYKWEMLAILWGAYFLNQGDRQIYNAVLPLIRADLHLSDVQLGLVVTVFTVLYGLFVPLAGCLGDFVAKKWIVCLSLLTFSAGTLLTGFSSGLLLLIVFRSAATGIGEAFYYPAANSLIGQYHRDTRAQAMAVHQTSLYIGVIVSSWLAGYIGENYGWRASFYAFGALGLLMVLVVATRLRNEYRDVEQISPSDRPAEPPAKLGEVMHYVLRTPTLYLLSLAFGASQFAGFGVVTWMPTYLYEKFHLSLKDAALYAMLYQYIFAFFGVMAGGRFSDRLAARRPTIRMEVEYLGLLLGVPFVWLMGTSSNLIVIYVALALLGFSRGLYDSNLFAALFDVIPLKYRSSATGLMLTFAFLLGAPAPLLLGYLKQHVGLGVGLSSLALVYLFGALVIWCTLRWPFTKDRLRAAEPIAEIPDEPLAQAARN